MRSWTQSDVEQAIGKIEAAKRKISPHVGRSPKTGATVGAKAERGAGAERAQPQRKETPDCVIGIDPGTNTGMATVSNGALVAIETTTIYSALRRIENLKVCFDNAGKHILVRFEDARLRTWFGKSGPEKWKGAGSIMRDCAIWEEMLTALGIPFEKVAPKDVKETSAEYFKKLTGWKGRTSVHSREAAWLVLPFLKPKNF